MNLLGFRRLDKKVRLLCWWKIWKPKMLRDTNYLCNNEIKSCGYGHGTFHGIFLLTQMGNFDTLASSLTHLSIYSLTAWQLASHSGEFMKVIFQNDLIWRLQGNSEFPLGAFLLWISWTAFPLKHHANNLQMGGRRKPFTEWRAGIRLGFKVGIYGHYLGIPGFFV